MASPTAALRLACSRWHDTKCAALSSASIEAEKRSAMVDCARTRAGSPARAASDAAAPACTNRRGGIETMLVSSLVSNRCTGSRCIDLLYRFTVSIYKTIGDAGLPALAGFCLWGDAPRLAPDQARRLKSADAPLACATSSAV